MNPFAAIEKWIKEHGSASILRDHVALLKEQMAAVKEENATLKNENAKLEKENFELKNQKINLEDNLEKRKNKKKHSQVVISLPRRNWVANW